MAAVQQVQATMSSEDLSSEPRDDASGSLPSLAVPGNGPTGPKRAETFSGFDSKLRPDNINRASSMRAPERPGMSFPSRQLPGTVSPVMGGSPKVKHKRRASGGGWPFLPKSNSKEDKEQGVTTGTCWGTTVFVLFAGIGFNFLSPLPPSFSYCVKSLDPTRFRKGLQICVTERSSVCFHISKQRGLADSLGMECETQMSDCWEWGRG